MNKHKFYFDPHSGSDVFMLKDQREKEARWFCVAEEAQAEFCHTEWVGNTHVFRPHEMPIEIHLERCSSTGLTGSGWLKATEPTALIIPFGKYRADHRRPWVPAVDQAPDDYFRIAHHGRPVVGTGENGRPICGWVPVEHDGLHEQDAPVVLCCGERVFGQIVVFLRRDLDNDLLIRLVSGQEEAWKEVVEQGKTCSFHYSDPYGWDGEYQTFEFTLYNRRGLRGPDASAFLDLKEVRFEDERAITQGCPLSGALGLIKTDGADGRQEHRLFVAGRHNTLAERVLFEDLCRPWEGKETPGIDRGPHLELTSGWTHWYDGLWVRQEGTQVHVLTGFSEAQIEDFIEDRRPGLMGGEFDLDPTVGCSYTRYKRWEFSALEWFMRTIPEWKAQLLGGFREILREEDLGEFSRPLTWAEIYTVLRGFAPERRHSWFLSSGLRNGHPRAYEALSAFLAEKETYGDLAAGVGHVAFSENEGDLRRGITLIMRVNGIYNDADMLA